MRQKNQHNSRSLKSKPKFRWDYKTLKAVPIPEQEHIADKILTALVIGMAIPAFLTSPFALYALAHGAARYFFTKSDFSREVKRLEKRGYVALTKTNKGWMVKLLPKGLRRKDKAELNVTKLPRKKVWDGKWRLIIFDIPEELRAARNSVGQKLKHWGCYNIQRSAFVFPHDCRKQIAMLMSYYGVGKYVLFAEVSYLDMNRELKKVFKV
jgi:hypothetical protein